jgi:hypothetical protein
LWQFQREMGWSNWLEAIPSYVDLCTDTFRCTTGSEVGISGLVSFGQVL